MLQAKKLYSQRHVMCLSYNFSFNKRLNLIYEFFKVYTTF